MQEGPNAMQISVVSDSPEFQVTDDLALLDAMLDDLRAADEVWQPTNYWSRYTDETIARLRSGLHDFRRATDGNLGRFGATDPPPRLVARIRSQDERLASALDDAVSQVTRAVVEGRQLFEGGPTLVDIFESGYERCLRAAAEHPAIVSIERLSVSRAGNPFGFLVDDRFLTASALNYYLRYAYVAARIDLETVDTVIELGSGAGRQAEILATLHPNLAIVQLDLAPQLYVADRYLNAALGDRVIPYRATRGDGPLQPQPGSVVCAGNFRVADVIDSGRTLFWNAASFGEMEPDVVLNYAKHVSQFSDWLFLHQCFAGKERGRVGGGGVLRQIRMAHYEGFFADYERDDVQPAHAGLYWLVEGAHRYDDSFWTRRSAG